VNDPHFKTGGEIKAAIASRMAQLRARLAKRNGDLDALMADRPRLRSYLVRSTESSWRGHGGGAAPLYSREDISSEEKEEIQQLCRRVFEIEQELRRLELIRSHLNDRQTFDLSYEDLLGYGFESSMSTD